MDVDAVEDDLFQSLLEEDENALANRWDALTQEAERIDAQQKELTARRERIEVRRALLRSIADLRKVELGAARDGGRDARINDGPSSTKDIAREVVEANPDRVWDAEALHDQIFDRGIETSRSNVRMILQRLAREDVLRRVAHGRYQSVHAGADDLRSQEDTKE